MRTLRISTQEKAISTDVNRAQAFLQADVLDLLRQLLNVSSTSDDDQLGGISAPNTVTTPLSAEIIEGLLVRPQGGSLGLSVDAGLLLAVAPDAVPSADESSYKYVRDAGVLSTAGFALAANAAGSTRIDVIECRINPIPATVTDNRDVFDDTTEQFSPELVTKETKSRLEYRVRQGVAGSGMPAHAEGWLPLCVASVPNGASSNDAITFWDVRPLVKDRARGAIQLARSYPAVERSNFVLDGRTDANALRMGGQFVGDLGGRRVGGALRRGTPGADADYLDLRAAANLASGYSLPASALTYVYLVTPFGLPRWARYTDGPSGRVPRAPKGIPVVTGVAPKHLTGAPATAIPLPDSTGLAGTATEGICIASTFTTSGAVPRGLIADGRVHWLREAVGFAPTLADLGGSVFNLVEGTTHPANARAIYVIFGVELNLAATTIVQLAGLVEVDGPGALDYEARLWIGDRYLHNTSAFDTISFPNSQLGINTAVVRIPIWPEYPAAAGGAKLLKWMYNATTIMDGTGGPTPPTFFSASMSVVGWELGP